MAEPETQKKRSSRWWIVGIIVLLVVAVVWFLRRSKTVETTHPRRVSLTETIASSARVGGVQESAVGAQFTGTVEHLFVKIGDRLKAGDPIATLKNDVTQRQKDQAQTAVQTAQAKLAQASRHPLPSEIDEARHSITEAQAQQQQLEAELKLASSQLERSQSLYRQGLISREQFDNATANERSLRARLASARATIKVRQAKLETLEKTPRAEDVMVAKAQLSEAEQALQVATQQTREAIVHAPYAGIVTTLNAQEGQTVGAAGVVNMVSDDLEIRVDLDENNLADLALGQKAVLSSTAFPGQTFDGHVTDAGAAVDEKRGVVTIKITADNPPAWLKPGQTVNVNLLTNEKADRLLVPSTAVLRQGSRSIVYVIRDGHATEQVVLTRPSVKEGVPIADGLSPEDVVIVDASAVKAGQAVRARGVR